MAEIFNIKDYGFERTVWANIKLSEMCPNKNIEKFEEIMSGEDTVEKLDKMMQIILIMNQAYERKAKFLDPNHEEKLISKEMLLNLDEDTLGTLAMTALGAMKEDGKVSIEAEPKKNEVEETR